MVSENTDDQIAALVIFSLSFTAVLFYSFALMALRNVYKETRNPFYLLMISLSCSDMIMLIIFAFYSTPATLLQRPLFGRQFETLILGTMCNFTYFSGLATQTNMALNRFWSICQKSTYKTVYNLRKMLVSVALCWLFGLVSCAFQLTPWCALRYYESEYTWGYDTLAVGNSIYVWYDRITNLLAFTLLAVLYSLIFRKLRQRRKIIANLVHHVADTANSNTGLTAVEKNANASDRNLVVQTALNALLIFLTEFFFTVTPMITENKWCSLFTSVVYISTLGLPPFIYAAFNRPVRQEIANLIRCLQWRRTTTIGAAGIGPGAARTRGTATVEAIQCAIRPI